jgi:pilus assembly protein CpaB
MSLKVIVLALILTTAAALGMIAYQIATPPRPAPQVQAGEPASLTVGYLVAAHALPAGTLARDEDFVVKMPKSAAVPDGAVIDLPDARATLRGALLRHYVEAGSPVTLADIIRSHDRGFLAAVLAPGSRAVTVGVDQVSGVAGLIWPGDMVDVILTQEFEQAQAPLARRVLSETVLSGVKVIAIDQYIVQGGVSGATAAGRPTKTVTLQVAADQAERLTVAQQLGHLALAVRAIGDAPPAEQATVYGGDVSPALARSALSGGSRMQVIERESRHEVTFK